MLVVNLFFSFPLYSIFIRVLKKKENKVIYLLFKTFLITFFFKDYCPLMCQLQRGGGNKNYELLRRIKYKESFVIDIGN